MLVLHQHSPLAILILLYKFHIRFLFIYFLKCQEDEDVLRILKRTHIEIRFFI